MTFGPKPERLPEGGWKKFHKVGVKATVTGLNSASETTKQALDEHAIPIGTEVRLKSWDPSDNSWLCRMANGDTQSWIFQDLLVSHDPVTDEEEKAALASIVQGFNPAAIESMKYTEGDVSHNVNPIIGMLRLRQQNKQQLSERDLRWAIVNLQKACEAEEAWLREKYEK